MERIIGNVIAGEINNKEDRHAMTICFFFFTMAYEMNKGSGWEARHKKIIQREKNKTKEQSLESYQKFFLHNKLTSVSYHYDYNYHSVKGFDLRVNFSLLVSCGNNIYIIRHEKYIKEIYSYSGFFEPVQMIYRDNRDLNKPQIDYDFLSYIL